MRRTFEIIESRERSRTDRDRRAVHRVWSEDRSRTAGYSARDDLSTAVGLAQHADAAGDQAATSLTAFPRARGTSSVSAWPTASSSTRSSAGRRTRCAASSASPPSAAASPIGRYHRRASSVSFPTGLRRKRSTGPNPCACASFPSTTRAIKLRCRHRQRDFLDSGAAPDRLHAGVGHEARVEVLRGRGRSLPSARSSRCARLTVSQTRFRPTCRRTCWHIGWFPFSRLFPRAAAVVHHGGIGTTSLALKAAVPQLIMPMAFDQHDNARRLERLGVARSLSPRKFRGPAVARLLRELHQSRPRSPPRAGPRASVFEDEPPLGEACRWIERAVSDGA